MKKTGLRILITSGATREPIDGVRYLSNISTGKTGARLAEFFHEAGFSVMLVHGEGAVEPRLPLGSIDLRKFTDYASLDRMLQQELGRDEFFAVLHLAAVSDYSVSAVVVDERTYAPSQLKKIDSGAELGLVLKRNPKILDRLKHYGSQPGFRAPLAVGFKLTNGASPEQARIAVEKVQACGAVDLVVHNDLAQIQGGEGGHRFQLFKGTQAPRIFHGTEELGTGLVEAFREYL